MNVEVYPSGHPHHLGEPATSPIAPLASRLAALHPQGARRICVVGGTKHGDEDRGRSDFTGHRIDDGHSGMGVQLAVEYADVGHSADIAG